MELTEDEKFMICKLAGVRTVIHQRADFSLHERTASPCAVIWNGSSWTVYVGREE
jgi:hypothetical protein